MTSKDEADRFMNTPWWLMERAPAMPEQKGQSK